MTFDYTQIRLPGEHDNNELFALRGVNQAPGGAFDAQII